MARPEKFSNRTYAAPFGRYQAGTEAEPPADEVLIGRAGQRAYFIDILLRAGRRGAYLVTGNRGVGKSSFVRYCLREYEEEVFERFLRSNVGRTFFWDRIGVLVLLLCAPMFLLMVAQVMEVLVLAASGANEGGVTPAGILSWLVLAPLWIVCGYPILYGREGLTEILKTSAGARLASFLSVLLTFLLSAIVWVARPFGSPALSLSRLLCVLGVLYLWVRATSFQRPRDLTSSEISACSDTKKIAKWQRYKGVRLFLHRGLFGYLFPAGMALPLLEGRSVVQRFGFHAWRLTPPESGDAYLANILFGLTAFGCGLLFHGFHLGRSEGGARSKLRRGASRVYLLSGSLFGGVGWSLLATEDPSLSLGMGILAVGALVSFLLVRSWYASWWQQFCYLSGVQRGVGERYPRFRPRPRQILLFKVVVSIVVGLQVTYPVLDKIYAQVRTAKIDRFFQSLDALYIQDSCGASLSTPAKGRVCSIPLWMAGDFIDTAAKGIAFDVPGAGECWLSGFGGYSRSCLQRIGVSSRDDKGSLFLGFREEIRWIAALFLLVAIGAVVEYEWIVRSTLNVRDEPSVDERGRQENQSAPEVPLDLHAARRLANLSLPWILYSSWLPVLTVAVNLGFERLDHRRVIQAMLVGLRDRYYRAFLGWNSPIANFGRLVVVISVLALTTLAAAHWFMLPPESRLDQAKLSDIVGQGYSHICVELEKASISSSAAPLVCRMKWGEEIFHFLYFGLLGTKDSIFIAERRHLLYFLLPYEMEPWPSRLFLERAVRNAVRAQVAREEGSSRIPVAEPRRQRIREEIGGRYRIFMERGLHLRVYHVLIFSFLFVIVRWLLRKLPLVPYVSTARKIDDILDSLTASTSVTSKVGRWRPAQWLDGFLVGERVRQTQQEPFDPRTIEFLFLQVLEDVQEAAIKLPGARNQRISLPVPEITFFFDELDKLGTRIDPAIESAGEEAQQAEVLGAERRRSLELHKLLSEMKNLLSAAPARFIFVGGRNLHDEWLADQTSRQPLLTNIFTAEVYLPSLLTDYSKRQPVELERNIDRFVAAQFTRAWKLFTRYQVRLIIPSFSLRLDDVREESFVRSSEQDADGRQRESRLSQMTVFDARDGLPVRGRDDLVRDFIQFLTYRSMGNPKRLRELLSSFVRPVGRLIGRQTLREGVFCCDHLLVFDDIERFRIQLIARIFRHLSLAFHRGLLRRDDKVVVSAFYLSDFLFKFHRRAFSWSNLERVEDMVHIHRAPDLRRVLETLVERWAERFLHRIRNGMYDFRFRSEIAREIEHISRQSPEEMAEFNFTLDESQALKMTYEAAIRRLKEGKNRELQDLIAGLGELHEFDQEFETARYHYRHAISLLDADLRALTGGSELLEVSSPMMQILSRRQPGPENARLYLTWGIARLRLMLQVGMTYELARNHERASVEYDNGGTLARSLLYALLDDDGRFFSVAYRRQLEGDKAKAGANGSRGEALDDRLEVLKHLNLLFQPVFASAWVAEKLIGAVDTSVTLVEETLDELRAMLPFVREAKVNPAKGPVRVGHSNFALIAAELHNKAGDLYFLKGRQVTSREAITEFARERAASRREILEWRKQPALRSLRPAWTPRHGQEGYLLRAHLHYAVGLHELRRFIAYRKLSSAEKWNIKSEKAFGQKPLEARETIETEGWPDYVFRSLGGTFNDFAEVMLGRVSIYGILRGLADFDIRPPTKAPQRDSSDRATERLVRMCSKWLELPSVRNQKRRAIDRVKDAERREREILQAEAREVEAREAQEAEAREVEAVDYRIVIPLGENWLDCGTLGGWFGYWNENWEPKKREKNIVTFDEWKEHDDLERLSVALNLMLVGAKYLERGGYFEDGAREFLKVTEIAVAYLWWWRIIRHVVDHPEKNEKNYEMIAINREACTKEVRKHEFWDYLGSIAQYSLEKADQLFRQSRQTLGDRTYLVGEKIPVSCLGAACSLGLISIQLGLSRGLQKRTFQLIARWTGKQSEWVSAVERADLVDVLKEALERHSYPMLARLNGLNLRIVDALLSVPTESDLDETIRAGCQELFELTEDLNSPLHFTPMQPGITFALVYLLRGEWIGVNDPELETFRRRAQHYLLRSEEMYTLKRAFYEGIAELYFLYDDFNDRQVHFHHALQMAGSELVTMLRYLVTSKDYIGIVEDPLTVPMSSAPMVQEETPVAG